jgi:hypothetical protein
MPEKIVNFIDVTFPVKKYFKTDIYQRLHTFPINKRTLDAYTDKLSQTYDMKIIPVINLVGDKEYMVYIRKNPKVRK